MTANFALLQYMLNLNKSLIDIDKKTKVEPGMGCRPSYRWSPSGLRRRPCPSLRPSRPTSSSAPTTSRPTFGHSLSGRPEVKDCTSRKN